MYSTPKCPETELWTASILVRRFGSIDGSVVTGRPLLLLDLGSIVGALLPMLSPDIKKASWRKVVRLSVAYQPPWGRRMTARATALPNSIRGTCSPAQLRRRKVPRLSVAYQPFRSRRLTVRATAPPGLHH